MSKKLEYPEAPDGRGFPWSWAGPKELLGHLLLIGLPLLVALIRGDRPEADRGLAGGPTGVPGRPSPTDPRMRQGAAAGAAFTPLTAPPLSATSSPTAAPPSSVTALPSVLSSPEAYPPPRPPEASPPPDPAVAADGDSLVPAHLYTRVEALDRSPHGAFLQALQAELDAGDLPALLGRKQERDLFTLQAVGIIEGGVEQPGDAVLAQLLQALLSEGPRPRVQAYAADADDERCLEVITAPWGQVRLPATATPQADEESYGQGSPDFLGGPAARWHFCPDEPQGGWLWEEWWFGSSIQLLEDAGGGSTRPWILVRPAEAMPPDDASTSPNLPEVPTDFPDSPDGLWQVHRFEGPVDEGLGAWPTRLEVRRKDGSARWLVRAEMSKTGVCLSPRLPLGWSADGRSFFSGFPGCFEGCTQFSDPWDITQLDLETGAARSIPDGSLAPDGRSIVAAVKHEGAWWLQRSQLDGALFRTAIRIPGVPAGEDTALGAAIWSADSRSIALTELTGSCCTERSSAIHIVRQAPPTGGLDLPPLVHRGRFALKTGVVRAKAWEPDGHVRLTFAAVGCREASPWWLKPETGVFGVKPW